LMMLVAFFASLYLYCLSNPFYIPTIDDSAIVMRYLKNFQQHHFYSYNVEDGPVYGVSCFWLGIAAGALSWGGLEPQASLMTVALVATFLFFFAALRIFLLATKSAPVSIVLGCGVFCAAQFVPKTMFLGLETPLHLWLVAELILAFLNRRARLFYVLCAACVISKLDASFIVAFLCVMRLTEAHRQRALAAEIKAACLFFVVPFLAWLVIATIVFGSPIPQSFLSKFFLRPKASKTSWFPFLEPLIDSKPSVKSMSLVLASLVLAIILKVFNKVSDSASSTFAVLFIGTMTLYFFYNPGEKMPWYYPLPEFMALMGVVLLPVSIFKSEKLQSSTKLMMLVVSVGLAVAVIYIRQPLNRDAVKSARVWQEVFEKERMEAGLLANEVAPQERPVLWTGHGYPAYSFKGYVVDYAGLNFRKIWAAVDEAREPTPGSTAFLRSLGLTNAAILDPAGMEYKAGLLLMKNHEPNVYMQHGLFPAAIQAARKLRLMGSFYTIDLVGAPAFRVFAEDVSWKKITVPVAEGDIVVSGANVKNDTASFPLWKQGSAFEVKVARGTSELLFGVGRKSEPFEVVMSMPNGTTHTCSINAIRNPYGNAEVQSCAMPIDVSMQMASVVIATASPSDVVTLYEMAVTVAEN
jgi:hypothetical protein